MELQKVSASIYQALLEPVNLAVILALSLPVLGLGLSINMSNWVSILVFLIALGFLLYFFWAVTSRSLEVKTTGVTYNEALLKRFFAWQEIEGILIERQKKQITFHKKGRNTRIHYIGISPREYIEFDKAFLSLANRHEIRYAEFWKADLGVLIIGSQGIGYKMPRQNEILVDWGSIDKVLIEQHNRTIVVVTPDSEGRLSYRGINPKERDIFENSLFVLAQKHGITIQKI